MTLDVRTWGTSPGGNNFSGALFPESLAPNETTDNLRELQAAIRRYANEAEWFGIGDLDGPATYTFISGTQFRVENISLASRYQVGRRVRATGTNTGVIYGTITARTGVASGTTVTVDWDSGSLSNEELLIELGVNSALNSSIPGIIPHAVQFTGAVSFVNGPVRLVNLVRVDPTTDIAIPETTNLLMVEAFGGGGGGSASGASFGAAPLGGSAGGATIVSATGLTLRAEGGSAGAASTTGQNRPNSPGSSISGATGFAITNQGAPGGHGGIYGHPGNHGDYLRAFVSSPSFTTANVSGGNQGLGGSGSSNGNGSNGSPGFAVFSFYE